MKRLLASTWAAALLIPAAAVQAQSVTIFGIVDEFLALHKTGGQNYKKLESSGLMGSRLGFRGTEDLGDGLKANFLLEAGLNPDTGTQADAARFFNRQSWVGLSGGFGEARLGRQNSPQFFMIGQFDAFQGATMGSGLNNLAFYTPRFDNSLAYLAPALGPVKLQLLLSLNEGTTGRRFAATVAAAEYKDGPAYVGFNYAETQNPANLVVTKASFLGGNYDLGSFKLFGGYFYAANSNHTLRRNVFALSVDYRLSGALSLIGGLARADDKKAANADGSQFSLGLYYDLSKRTRIYSTASHLTNKNTATFSLNGATALGVVPAPGNDVNGLQLGVRHQF